MQISPKWSLIICFTLQVWFLSTVGTHTHIHTQRKHIYLNKPGASSVQMREPHARFYNSNARQMAGADQQTQDKPYVLLPQTVPSLPSFRKISSSFSLLLICNSAVTMGNTKGTSKEEKCSLAQICFPSLRQEITLTLKLTAYCSFYQYLMCKWALSITGGSAFKIHNYWSL